MYANVLADLKYMHRRRSTSPSIARWQQRKRIMTDLPSCKFRTVRSCCSRSYLCQHNQVHTPGNIVDHWICTDCRFQEPGEPEVEADANSPPPMTQRAWNLAESLTAFVADGLRLVSRGEYQSRLQICEECTYRTDSTCTKCGCIIALKARGRAFQCPEGLWPPDGK
jgi:hypothetical protein